MQIVLEFIKVLILGIVEGITEWLPISSTGHLILVNEFLRLNVTQEYMDMFNYVIQLGAILAVVTLYFRRLNPLDPGKDERQKKRTIVLWCKVIVAVIPAAVIGLPINDFVDSHLSSPVIVAAMLIIYGVLFLKVEDRNQSRLPSVTNLDRLDYPTALKIGLFQVLSIIPGTSRSGSTILGGILVGTSRGVAAEFSFFMAIPVMFGVSFIKIVKFLLESGVAGFTMINVIYLLAGMAVSYFVSIIAIRFLMDYVKNHSFKIFGWYRIGLGILVLLYFGIRQLVVGS